VQRAASALAGLVLAGLLPSVGAGAPLRAERIREESAPELLIGGPDAVGGVGDWYLANDVVEFIVDDPGRRHATLNHGGTIVDAGLLDRRGEDQFCRLFPLLNLDQKVLLQFDAIRAEVDPGGAWARLVVTSTGGLGSVLRGNALSRALDPRVPAPEELRGVGAETEYAVFPGEPWVHITTTLRNQGDAPAPVFAYGDVWMRGGRSMRAFVGNALAPERSRGFHHRSFDRTNLLRVPEALAAFTHVSVPGLRRSPPIAYALFSPERAARGLVQFGVTGEHVTFANAFVGDPDWDEIGVLRMVAAMTGALAPGEVWSYRRRLLVTGRADVASTTDVMLPVLGAADGRSGIAGRVEPADEPSVLLVRDAATGALVTQAETPTAGPEAGRYRAVLPPGDYAITARAPQRPDRELRVRVEPGATAELPPIVHPEPGWLVFDPAFADGGPGRVVVTGAGGTPDPVFDPELLDFRIDGRPSPSGTERRDLFFVGNASDPGRVAIAPGRYRLTAARGLEHDVVEREIEVASGAEARVPPFALRRAVELDGAIRADFHVHAEASDDSGMSNEERLRSFLAEAVDLIVTTDHDNLGWFEPALDALGVRDRIRVLQGVEVTGSAPSSAAPWTLGHHNAWPLRYAPLAHRRGAPPSQGLALPDLYALLRRDYGAEVVQLNHPRDAERGVVEEGAYFTHLGAAGTGFDPGRPIDAGPNRALLETASDGETRAIDFDAMEVMNGRTFDQFLRVREDWYALLRQGFARTGTANSDTHGPGQLAAYPRNYALPAGRAGSASPRALNAAVREGRLFGTNGPLFTRFRVAGGGMGDLVQAGAGCAEVEIRVEAARWVPVPEVRLLVNGEVARAWRGLPRNGDALRLDRREELCFARDAFVTLEAGVPLDTDEEAWVEENAGTYAAVVAPRHVPTAFANPIWVDVDGDGHFDPPGLSRVRREPAWGPWLVTAGVGAIGVSLAVRRPAAARPRARETLEGD
jgi:hypothetical protein